ncbi:MAG: tetratricopeptide repeat protein, partial [Myxococcota bacterium]|nr:tetratricopeptide repeat protein [Myxococcota bacterium]
STSAPRWELETTTLDPATVEQLQALGYVGNSSDPDQDGLDPRDGLAQVERFHKALQAPPSRQLNLLTRLLEEVPGMRDARIRLSLLHARAGDLTGAMAQLTTAYQRTPDSTVALMLAEQWLQARDYREALHWFREALDHDPRSMDARAGEVEALALLGRTAEAAALADLALTEAPDHARLVTARAQVAAVGQEPVAPWRDRVLEIAEQRPFEPRLLHTAGTLSRLSGDLIRAEDLLRDELRWRPANIAARLELLDLYREQGRNVDAFKTLRPLLALEPEEPRWNALAAQTLLAMGREHTAAPYRRACTGHPLCP